MNLNRIKVIISREYLTRVRKKSFLLITFLGPVFFAAMCVLPSLIMFMVKDKGNRIAVVDESGIVMRKLAGNDAIEYDDRSGESIDSLKASCSGQGYNALLTVSPIDTAARSVSVSIYSEKPLSVDIKSDISIKVNEAVEDYRLSLYDIGNLKHIIEDVRADVPISTYILGDDGKERISSSEVYMIVSLVLSLIIYTFIAMFSGMVMQSVIEEKTSRVVEVLVSSVKATELMFGKIIGVAGVALTQFFLWVVLTVALVAGVSLFTGFDALTENPAAGSGQMAQISDGLVSGGDAVVGMAVPDPSELVRDSELSVVLTTLKDIDYVRLIISFMMYFFFGYLLYASLFAAIGSAVENEADTLQLQIPVTVPLLIAFFISFYAFKAPDSQVVLWGSMIPFTSPIVMLARIPFGVPVWQLLLSMALLALTFCLCAYLSAKIYRIGILVSGKKTTFKDLYKWLKMK